MSPQSGAGQAAVSPETIFRRSCHSLLTGGADISAANVRRPRPRWYRAGGCHDSAPQARASHPKWSWPAAARGLRSRVSLHWIRLTWMFLHSPVFISFPRGLQTSHSFGVSPKPAMGASGGFIQRPRPVVTLRHPKKTIRATTNSPIARKARMRGGEPLREKLSGLVESDSVLLESAAEAVEDGVGVVL